MNIIDMNITRRAALVLVSVLAVAACAPGVSPVADTAADQAAIRAAHRALQHAYYSNDIEASSRLLLIGTCCESWVR